MKRIHSFFLLSLASGVLLFGVAPTLNGASSVDDIANQQITPGQLNVPNTVRGPARGRGARGARGARPAAVPRRRIVRVRRRVARIRRLTIARLRNRVQILRARLRALRRG